MSCYNLVNTEKRMCTVLVVQIEKNVLLVIGTSISIHSNKLKIQCTIEMFEDDLQKVHRSQ